MLCCKEKLESSDRACYGKFLRGHGSEWFLLFISTCRFVEFDNSIICHVLVHCFGPFLLQEWRDILSLQVFAFERQNMTFSVNVLLPDLHSKLWRRARLWLELFTSTEGRFWSLVSYLPSYVFLRRSRSSYPGEVLPKNWVGVCGPLPKTLALFMTKICDIPYPIYDLTKNLKPYLWPDS